MVRCTDNYQSISGKTTSTFRKTILHNDSKVIFEMIDFKQKTLLAPRILSSGGYYKITSQDRGYLVEYFQQCTLENNAVNELYIIWAKNEAIQFILNLKKYAENTCH